MTEKYKFTRQLACAIADKGLVETADIDEVNLEVNETPVVSTATKPRLTQSYLNNLFNQGKGLDASGNVVQVGKTYSGGEGITVNNTTISVNTATENTLGGVKVYDTRDAEIDASITDISAGGTNNYYYGVQLDGNNQAFVSVPEIDTLDGYLNDLNEHLGTILNGDVNSISS